MILQDNFVQLGLLVNLFKTHRLPLSNEQVYGFCLEFD